MTSLTIEEAFQRLPRPQVPTKAALLERLIRKEQEQVALSGKIYQNPWKTLSRQGDLVQGRYTWSICLHGGRLVLVKKSDIKHGRQELEKVSRLSDHPNVATVQQAFESDMSLYLQFEYTRYTLEEVLSVHSRLGETHIRVIASAIFLGIKHIAKTGIVHNALTVTAIRFCRSSGRPILSSFEDSIWATAELTPNVDLEQLGVIVLECMNRLPNEDLRNPVEIRHQRKSNKMFGLREGEKWSGYKLLVDFLNNMFNKEISAIAKLEKLVSAHVKGLI